MKRILIFLTALMLMTAPALAAEDSIILTGTVQTIGTVALKAPASGELAPFTVRAGDVAKAGETLFTVEPVKVYSPIDGVMAAVYAKPGDAAAGVTGRYGAVAYIDHLERYQLLASTRAGVDKAENRDVRVGQQVYLRSNNEANHADGVITAVDGATGNITVQIIGGDLVFTHTIKVFRTPDYEYNSTIARGTISTVAPHALSASGTIIDVAVKAGDSVQAGDYLFSYVPDELAPERRGAADATAAKAEEDWLITAVSVQPGAAVQKGQTLLTAVRIGDYELTAQAAEDEISRIKEGDVFTVCFEELDIDPVEATVSFVSPLGTVAGDETTYTVRFTFDVPEGVWPGMHATLER